MIQRIQTIFLFLTTILSLLLFYVPAYIVPDLSGISQYHKVDNSLMLIVNGAIGVLSFIGIFLFKMRNVQIRLTNLAMLLTCILAGLIFFVGDVLSSGLQQQVKFTFGSYFPLIQLVLLFLAGRFIKKDEELVRSADRLR